jgi:HD-like signal output (HDOD) protein/ActR/RegA family two-component response regulator
MAKTKILIGESDDEAFGHVRDLIAQIGLKVVRATRAAEVIALAKAGVDLAIINLKDSDFGSESFMQQLEPFTGLGWMVEADEGSPAELVNALRAGCCDWVARPASLEDLQAGLKRIEKRHKRRILSKPDVSDAPRSSALVKEIARRIREGNIDLPEVPQVIKDLNIVLQDLEVETAKVVDIVGKDPSLSARIVSTANAVTYGGNNWTDKITDLGAAITRMGNMAVRNLVQAEAIKDMFQFRSPAFKAIFDKMWQSHFLVAKVSREIAVQREKDNVDETYLFGLVHNIGELFLLRVFGEFFQRNNNQILSMDEVLSMVREWHTVFGAGLLKKWEMGEEIEFVAKVHHTPAAYTDENTPPDQKDMLYTIALACQLSEYSGHSYYTKGLYLPGIQECYEYLKLSTEAKDQLRDKMAVIQAGG